MLSLKCPSCAKQYKIPEKLAGKRVRCKKCGEPIAVPKLAPIPELEEEILGNLGRGVAEKRPTVGGATVESTPTLPGTEWSTTSAGPSEPSGPTGFGPYMRDVGKSLLFFTYGGDLVTFLFVCAMVCLQFFLAHGGCFGRIGFVIVTGWYMGFRLNVVLGAAGGESDLPNLTLDGGLEGIILPIIKWLAAWIAALIPFMLGLLYLVLLGGQLSANGAYGAFLAALMSDFLTVTEQYETLGWLVGGVLLLLPMTLWPMLVLVVAVGGIPSLARPDLIAITLFRTLPAYILVVVLTFVGVIAPSFLSTEGVPGMTVLFTVLQVYAGIFTMRVIGLYYHHFKSSFAWSWG